MICMLPDACYQTFPAAQLQCRVLHGLRACPSVLLRPAHGETPTHEQILAALMDRLRICAKPPQRSRAAGESDKQPVANEKHTYDNRLFQMVSRPASDLAYAICNADTAMQCDKQ